jgi:hypothetical protein
VFFFSFGVKVGVEESIMNPPPDYTTLDQLFKSNLTFWFLICSLKSQSFFKTSGSFTIDSSTPTLTDKKNTFIVIATFTKMEEFPILNILLTLKTLQTSPNTYV